MWMIKSQQGIELVLVKLLSTWHLVKTPNDAQKFRGNPWVNQQTPLLNGSKYTSKRVKPTKVDNFLVDRPALEFAHEGNITSEIM